MQILRIFARVIIIIMLIFNVVLWTTICILGFAYSVYWLGAIGLCVALFFVLYTAFVWGRIKFTSVLIVKCFLSIEPLHKVSK